MRPAVIFDIDGTLASIRWRLDPYLAQGRTPAAKRAFYAGQEHDSPVPGIAALTHVAREAGYAVILCTARSTTHRDATIDWLLRHGIVFDDLLMAPQNDQRTDDEYKLTIYREVIAPQYDVVLVVDDRPHVVAMWEATGLTVLAVTDPHLAPVPA